MHVSSAASQAGIVPRWHIDANALAVLETFFGVEMFPNVEARKQLGQDLQVSPRQIQVWFQNRRQRERKRKEIAHTVSTGSIPSTWRTASPLGSSMCEPHAEWQRNGALKRDMSAACLAPLVRERIELLRDQAWQGVL